MAAWYEDYLKSDHWRKIRVERILQAEINDEWGVIKCEHKDCGLYVPLRAIDVHHLTYRRVGCERMEDLQVYCRSCHGVTHGYMPKMWWTYAKSTGRKMLTWGSINQDRKLKHIGDVMQECLAFCDERIAVHQERFPRVPK